MDRSFAQRPVWLEEDVHYTVHPRELDPGWRTLKPSLPPDAKPPPARPQLARARMQRQSPRAAGIVSRNLKPPLPAKIYGPRDPSSSAAAAAAESSDAFAAKNAWVMLNRHLPHAPEAAKPRPPKPPADPLEGLTKAVPPSKRPETDEERLAIRQKVEREAADKAQADRRFMATQKAKAQVTAAAKAAAMAQRVAESQARLAKRALLVARRDELRVHKCACGLEFEHVHVHVHVHVHANIAPM